MKDQFKIFYTDYLDRTVYFQTVETEEEAIKICTKKQKETSVEFFYMKWRAKILPNDSNMIKNILTEFADIGNLDDTYWGAYEITKEGVEVLK